MRTIADIVFHSRARRPSVKLKVELAGAATARFSNPICAAIVFIVGRSLPIPAPRAYPILALAWHLLQIAIQRKR
jgi:hypothetical protein